MLWSEVMANRARFLETERPRYLGMHVAWSLDGTHIVAASVDLDEVWRQVVELGFKGDEVAFSYVEDPNDQIFPIYFDHPREKTL